MSSKDKVYWLKRLKQQEPALYAAVKASKLSLYKATVTVGWRKLTHPYPKRVLHMFDRAVVFVVSGTRNKADKKLLFKSLDRILSETNLLQLYATDHFASNNLIQEWIEKGDYSKNRVQFFPQEVHHTGNGFAAINRAQLQMLKNYALLPTKTVSCLAIAFEVGKKFEFADHCRRQRVKIWYPETEW